MTAVPALANRADLFVIEQHRTIQLDTKLEAARSSQDIESSAGPSHNIKLLFRIWCCDLQSDGLDASSKPADQEDCRPFACLGVESVEVYHRIAAAYY